MIWIKPNGYYYSDGFDWKIEGIFDRNQILNLLKIEYGDSITINEIFTYEFQSSSEIKIKKVIYYPSKTEIRDKLINNIITKEDDVNKR